MHICQKKSNRNRGMCLDIWNRYSRRLLDRFHFSTEENVCEQPRLLMRLVCRHRGRIDCSNYYHLSFRCTRVVISQVILCVFFLNYASSRFELLLFKWMKLAIDHQNRNHCWTNENTNSAPLHHAHSKQVFWIVNEEESVRMG